MIADVIGYGGLTEEQLQTLRDLVKMVGQLGSEVRLYNGPLGWDLIVPETVPVLHKELFYWFAAAHERQVGVRTIEVKIG